MNVSLTVSLDERLVSKIESNRGELPRSKYISQLLERAYTGTPVNGGNRS